MNREVLIHRLLYAIGALIFLTTIFVDELGLDLFLKPLMIIFLCYVYILKTNKIRYLVLLSMAIVTLIEVLTMLDFIAYFKEISILYSIYYLMNIILLWESLQKIKIQFKNFFTIQLLITIVLIGYVLCSVADLILPNIELGSRLYLKILIACFMLFIICCYYIYLNSRTIVSSSLMVAASCFLIVNTIIAFNEFYLYVKVFIVIGHMLQIFGQYFLLKFYAEEYRLKLDDNEEYF